jgi:hypothetical protein
MFLKVEFKKRRLLFWPRIRRTRTKPIFPQSSEVKIKQPRYRPGVTQRVPGN